jgi:replicative DNA helicase
MAAMTSRPTRHGEAVTLVDLLDETDRALGLGLRAGATVHPTGFAALDKVLAGGLRSGELALVCGPQGLGKTTMTIQMLRHAVAKGGTGLAFSYEHEGRTLLERLIALEASESAPQDFDGSARVGEVRKALEIVGDPGESIASRTRSLAGVSAAIDRIRTYGDRLIIHESSSTYTDVEAIRESIAASRERTGTGPLVLVDYLQKVPHPEAGIDEVERSTAVVEQLKDLALEQRVPIIVIVAAEKEALVDGHRVRAQDMRGSSALAYEADVILMLNEKYDIVARHHLVYGTTNADTFRQWVVVSVEKNRGGRGDVDLEFEKRFEEGRFDPDGGLVQEQLIEGRVYTE